MSGRPSPQRLPVRVLPALAEAPRRQLTGRRAATLERLVQAALEEVRDRGYEGLSIRTVARRARVAPATAYTYFASKDHLLAEVFWRRLHALPPTQLRERWTAAARVNAVMRDLQRLVEGEPELAAACTLALLSTDPEVRQLQARVGAEIRRRLQAALGESARPAALRALQLAVTGALVLAGMGHLRYDDLPDLLAEVAQLLVGGGD